MTQAKSYPDTDPIEAIRAWLYWHKLTQADLAGLVNDTQAHISSYLAYSRPLGLSFIRRFHDAFPDFPVEVLIRAYKTKGRED